MIKFVVVLSLCLLIHQTHTQCKGNKALFQGACVSDCPINYVNSQEKGVRECKECIIQNFEVPNKKMTQCECSRGYYRVPFSGVCQKCHYTCFTCNGPTANDCIQCSSEQLITNRIKLKKNCSCLPGYFDDVANEDVNCVKCHPDCATCTGPEDTQCTTCLPGRIRNEFGFCLCPQNFISQDNGKCDCPQPYRVVKGICVELKSKCGPNQAEIITPNVVKTTGNSQGNVKENNIKANGNNLNLNGIIQIRESVDTVVQAIQTTVQTARCECRSGFIKVKGLCTICGLNQQYNQKSKKCQCVNGAKKFKKLCILCPKDQKYNVRTGQCSCKNKNFFQTSKGECIKCGSHEVFINNQCQCVPNYILNKNGKCGKCPKGSVHPNCSIILQGADKAKKLILDEI